MKVTFQEVFSLGSEADDRLFPLSYGDELLNMVPAYSFEGLTLLGKGGEVKGPFARKVAIPFFPILFRVPAVFFPLYLNKEGKEKLALGMARDAYTVKWRDIKDRVLDDMSEADYLERLKLLRGKLSEEDVPQYR